MVDDTNRLKLRHVDVVRGFDSKIRVQTSHTFEGLKWDTLPRNIVKIIEEDLAVVKKLPDDWYISGAIDGCIVIDPPK